MPRTTNPINKRPSGSWQVRYRDAEGRQRARSFRTAGEAQAFLDQTRTNVRMGTYIAPDAGRETFGAYAHQWGQAQDWTYGTRQSFHSAMKRVDGTLGDVRLDQIDSLRIQRLRQSLASRYATATATLTLHYACAVIRAAFQNGRIPRDPTIGVKPPKSRDGREPKLVDPYQIPSAAEVAAIIAATPSRLRAAVALGACGLRIGEVMGVTPSRLDLDARTLTIDRQLQLQQRAYVLVLPKRDKVRTITLPSWASLELRRHVREHSPFWPLQGMGADDALLFRGGRDAPLRRDAFYASAWRPALAGAGLPDDRYVFHSLRHWCASQMLAELTPLPEVAGYLGDTIATVMETYAHWLPDRRDLSANALDRALRLEPPAAQIAPG